MAVEKVVERVRVSDLVNHPTRFPGRNWEDFRLAAATQVLHKIGIPFVVRAQIYMTSFFCLAVNPGTEDEERRTPTEIIKAYIEIAEDMVLPVRM